MATATSEKVSRPPGPPDLAKWASGLSHDPPGFIATEFSAPLLLGGHHPATQASSFSANAPSSFPPQTCSRCLKGFPFSLFRSQPTGASTERPPGPVLKHRPIQSPHHKPCVFGSEQFSIYYYLKCLFSQLRSVSLPPWTKGFAVLVTLKLPSAWHGVSARLCVDRLHNGTLVLIGPMTAWPSFGVSPSLPH